MADDAKDSSDNPQESMFFEDGKSSAPVKSVTGRQRRYALTDEGLEHFRKAYPGADMSKEDVFYYVNGLLHSPDYRNQYADNLAKELPRIPCVPGVDQAGRDLANLQLNYETVEPYPLTITVHGNGSLTDADYQVEKMRYGKNGKDKDMTTIQYNSRITVSGIPLEAYEYIVNGKPALDWGVAERQCVKTDKDSGIVSDANAWAVDTMKNPKYPLELIGKVVAVALGTRKIVDAACERNMKVTQGELSMERTDHMTTGSDAKVVDPISTLKIHSNRFVLYGLLYGLTLIILQKTFVIQ